MMPRLATERVEVTPTTRRAVLPEIDGEETRKIAGNVAVDK